LPSTTLETARNLRRTSTDAERKLWQRLRAGQLGVRFRRQHSVPPYVLDFYCDAAKLVIEIDGSQHSDEVDRARSEFLQRMGLQVVRFWNNQVLLQLDDVLEEILKTVAASAPHPNPSPVGRGAKSGQACNAPLPTGEGLG
jgi:very-short-patch-repair endonuclease